MNVNTLYTIIQLLRLIYELYYKILYKSLIKLILLILYTDFLYII
jgi:hypothetical protein